MTVAYEETAGVVAIADAVIDGSSSARTNVEHALKLIAELNPRYNAVISTCDERALARADHIDTIVRSGGDPGRLAGVPFIVKDNFLTFGSQTTAASNILSGYIAPYQATAVEKLESEGAIVVAKANLDAFAHGSSTENSDFGPTKNPVDDSLVPGGSSGGSAASVALGLVPFALGTDTGGSIRLPASFCGVVGYKPTYGMISRYGVVAMASSTDVIGPLARSVEDASLITSILAGKDERDGTTLPDSSLSMTNAVDPRDVKVGVIKQYTSDDVDPAVRRRVQAATDTLRRMGCTVEEVDMPSLALALAVYYIVVPAEISSNLARYDGIRYGASSADASSLRDVYEQTRHAGFNDENKRRILIGNYVLSSGYYDAYYRKAQTVRTKLIHDFNDAFSRYDFLIGPVAPTPAFKLGLNTSDPLQMYLADIMTVSASLAGIPAISVPIPGDGNELPVGLQIMGPQQSDARLLALAAHYEKSSKTNG